MINLTLFGGFYPMNPTLGQKIQSEARGANLDAGFIAHLVYSAAEAVASDADAVHAAINASSDAVVEVTTAFTAPPCPRNITATAGGTAGSIKAVKVTVYGTDYDGNEMSEDLPVFTADTTGTVLGNKAFKTVTKVSIPAMDGAGVTVTIGFGDKLGIPYKLALNTVLKSFLNGALEAQAATVAASSTVLASNTVDLSSALDGHAVDIFLIV